MGEGSSLEDPKGEGSPLDATLTESEGLLQDMAARLAADLGPASVQDLEEHDPDASWKALAGVGLLALRAPAEAGGGEASTTDVVIVAEALAGRLLAAPYLGSAALVTELLLAAGAPAETISRVASGELRLAVAATADLSDLGQAGAPMVAPDAAGAEAVLCLEGPAEGSPPRLVAVAAGATAGALDMTRRWVRPDAGKRVDVGDLGGAIDPGALRRFECRALTLLSADLVGVSATALHQAVAYSAGRVQFGVPIGSFQALQHLCAEQAVSIEGARALTEYAAWAADELDLDQAMLAAHTAKAYCSSAGRAVTEAAVQVYGGMGITWECMAHVALKRALLDRAWFGDERAQTAAIAALRERMR